MIYRRHIFSLLAACNDMERVVLELLNLSPSKEDREFCREVRAHLADLTDLIKDQDY